jgi:hypothetical protein
MCKMVLGAIDEIAGPGDEFIWKALLTRLEDKGYAPNTARRFASEALKSRSHQGGPLIRQGYVRRVRWGTYLRIPPTPAESWIRHRDALRVVPDKLRLGEYVSETSTSFPLVDAREKPIASVYIAWRGAAPAHPRSPAMFAPFRAMTKSTGAGRQFRGTNKKLPRETIARAWEMEKQLRQFIKEEPTFGCALLRALLEEMERATPVIVSVFPIKSRRSRTGFSLRPLWQGRRQWTADEKGAIRDAWDAVEEGKAQGQDPRRVALDPRVKPYLKLVSGWIYLNTPELP